jgi:hypothetical protein
MIKEIVDLALRRGRVTKRWHPDPPRRRPSRYIAVQTSFTGGSGGEARDE